MWNPYFRAGADFSPITKHTYQMKGNFGPAKMLHGVRLKLIYKKCLDFVYTWFTYFIYYNRLDNGLGMYWSEIFVRAYKITHLL